MGSFQDRHNSSRGDARLLFVICINFQTNTVFGPVDVVMMLVVFRRGNEFSKSDPEVSGGSRGASPTY